MRNILRKLMLASVALPMIVLGGCAGTTSASLQADIASIEATVQADANVLCGFIPTAATVAAFIPGFGGIAASAATIATGICAAIAQAPVVTTKSARLGASGGADVQVAVAKTPNGNIPIVGHFTR